LTVATFEVQRGTPPFVDLSDRLRRCPRTLERTNESGTVELCHSAELPPQVAEQVAADYEAFFDLAQSLLGAGEHVTLLARLLDFDVLPESYRYMAERRGDEWRTSWITVLLVPRSGGRSSDEYWTQIGHDIHEMTHAYMGDGKQSCTGRNPAVRWLDDGVAELVRERYLALHAPQMMSEWYDGRQRVIDGYPLGSADRLFDWIQPEVDVATQEGAGWEASHYVASHRLVRYLHGIREGVPLREFIDRVGERPIWSPVEMKAAVFESFPELTEAQLAGFVK